MIEYLTSIFVIRFLIVSFSIRPAVFLPAAVLVLNIEQEISNDEVRNRCAQSFSIIIMLEYLTSIFVIPCLQSAGGGFDIRYSLFQSYCFDLTGRSRPEAALNSDT